MEEMRDAAYRMQLPGGQPGMPTDMSEGYDDGHIGAGLGAGPVGQMDAQSMVYGQDQYDEEDM